MPRKNWIGQNPRLFFEEYVVPYVEEWQNEPLAVRKAVVAICQLDALAEHVLCTLVTRGEHPKEQPAKFRNRMAAREPLLKVARDVHDTHKHGGLERDDALIKSGEPPRLAWVGRAFQPNAFQNNGFRLVIAKLDRLSCNLAFIATLMDSGVEFIAVANPHANKLTVHILAAVAQHEREIISARTSAALQAAKALGKRLGNPKLSEA
jgi:hypothetical protein